MRKFKDKNLPYTDNFDDLQKIESTYIDQRRKSAEIGENELMDYESRLKNIPIPDLDENWKLKSGKIGLAFSGGGIRSATFNLGVLQALNRMDILRFCDYLSTVSGGGYIGSCLSSLLDNPEASVKPDGFPFRFEREKESDERQEVKWLRRNSRFLAPKMNIFGLDLWRLIGQYLTGLVLTNITTAALVILLSFALYGVVSLIDTPKLWYDSFLWGALGIFIMMVFTRWLGALTNLGYNARLWRGRAQAFWTRTAAFLAIFGGLIALAYKLPGIADDLSILIGDFVSSAAAATLFGLLTGLLKSSNKLLQKLLNSVYKTALILVIPLLMALLIRLLWTTKAFDEIFWGLPEVVWYALGFLMVSLFTNINRINLHHFYRDRLSEAYIIKREKTFDDETIISNESLNLKDLHNQSNGAPYHLINATLNVPGSENRWLRGRGADFFIFSKYYCGAESTGYCATDIYAGGDIHIATPMAISGAAASPQMGSSTNSLFAFIMTLLNIRLNRWMPNPEKQNVVGLVFWPWYFVKELLNLGKETDRLLNLSDGGHHENLGVYQLLKRRCKVIIASDAGADPNYQFNDLGNLIRKARIDLGVLIDINLDDLRLNNDSADTKSHAVTGTINYPDGTQGIFIYLKTSIIGDEPEDILAYRRKNTAFPDESTGDQFFDECQFESYRQLGYMTGKSILSDD